MLSNVAYSLTEKLQCLKINETLLIHNGFKARKNSNNVEQRWSTVDETEINLQTFCGSLTDVGLPPIHT